MTNPRKITVEFSIDWEDYDDVRPAIVMEDAIKLKAEGVSYEIVSDSNKEFNDAIKKSHE